MSVYYNEICETKVAMLQQLMVEGFIPEGDIDTRSVKDILPYEIKKYKQAHFFAGIGIWAISVRDAKLEDTRLWTGSCPCQSFSISGRGEGFADERHLWPFWFYLIKECRPPIVFGEQVATGLGKYWLDLVRDDLDGEGYAFGASSLSASSAMAPHDRPRFYFGAVEDPTADIWGPSGIDLRSEKQFSVQPGYAGAAASLEKDSADWRDRVHRHYWEDIYWTEGRDGGTRPCKSSIQLVADGSSKRTSVSSAYGDGIVAPLAEQFMRCTIAAVEETHKYLTRL